VCRFTPKYRESKGVCLPFQVSGMECVKYLENETDRIISMSIGRGIMQHNELIKSIIVEGLCEIREWFLSDASDYLQSIFDQISIKDKTGNEKPLYVTPSFMQAAGMLQDNKEILLNNKQTLWQTVQNKYSSLSEEYLTNLSLYKAHYLLENLGGTIPANASKGKISIYDTYKIKAIKEAIKARRTKGPSSPANLLICADFSGIQQFIYNVSSQNALKNLRARSFFIELLTEHVVQQILELLQLHRIHLLFHGGGNFYILADNQDRFLKPLSDLILSLENWLVEQFNGRLNVNFATIPFSDEELNSSFKDILEKAAYKIFVEKQTKFKGLINRGAFKFLQERDPLYRHCEICFKDDELHTPGKNGAYLCLFCETMIKTGAALPKEKYIYKSASISSENSITMGNIRYIMADKKYPVGSYDTVWKICRESSDLEDVYNEEAIPLVSPYTRLIKDLPVRNQIEKRKNLLNETLKNEQVDDKVKSEITEEKSSLADDAIASLEWLAKSADGADLIGSLRMDADNMGKILQSGFSEGISLERLSALSRALSYFFKIQVHRICKGEIEYPTNITGKKDISKGRDVTVIYSGGDDLFLIGAWSDVAEVSLDIGKAFKQFTGNHLDVTLSGGMTLHDHKFPITRMAEMSAKALKAAKDNKQTCWLCRKEFLTCPLFEKGLCGRKDSLSLFYTDYTAALSKTLLIEKQSKYEDSPPRLRIALKWARVEENKGIINEIKVYAEDVVMQYWRIKDIPRGFFHRSLQLLTVWYNRGYLYMPQIVWLLEKAKKGLRNRTDKETGTDYYELLDRQLHLFEPYRMSCQHIPLMWIIYLTRGGEISEDKTDRGKTY